MADKMCIWEIIKWDLTLAKKTEDKGNASEPDPFIVQLSFVYAIQYSTWLHMICDLINDK
jgi:hypothetical protein